MMVAVDIANEIRRDLGPLTSVPEFGERVARYIAAQARESGIWYLPAPLGFANQYAAGFMQECLRCSNEEEEQDDGLCSYCTDRYRVDSLQKMEPDERLAKKFDSSKVRPFILYPYEDVSRRLTDALTKKDATLGETPEDVCAARLLTGLEYMSHRRAQLRQQSELQKLAGISAGMQPAAQEPKKKNIITRNIGAGTLIGTGIAGALALKNPTAAKGFAKGLKEIATKPVQSMKRGWREGASNIRSGLGAESSASKRVEHMKETFRSAGEGKFRSVSGLDAPDSLRGSGWLSMGVRQADGLKLDPALQKRVSAAREALDAGKRVPEEQLANLYGEIQAAGKAQGLKPRAGLDLSNPYLPGERAVETLGGVVGGAAGGMPAQDEDGKKRGIAERLTRAGVGAVLGASTAPFVMSGRGMGLSKANVIPGLGKGPSFLSQKGLLPAVAAVPIAAGTGIAADAAGSGASLVDKAFGQSE
jgi:hypothetical protein